MKNAIENMSSHPLAEYKRKWYNNICEGSISNSGDKINKY